MSRFVEYTISIVCVVNEDSGVRDLHLKKKKKPGIPAPNRRAGLRPILVPTRRRMVLPPATAIETNLRQTHRES